MPFREKNAWLTIFALVIVFLPYYVFMVRAYHGPDPYIPYLLNTAAHALIVFVCWNLSCWRCRASCRRKMPAFPETSASSCLHSGPRRWLMSC